MKYAHKLSLLRWGMFLVVVAMVSVAGWGAGLLEAAVVVALLYPTALGVISGILIAFWVQLAFVPRPGLVVVLSILLGLAAIVGLHAGRYAGFKSEYGALVRDAALEGVVRSSDVTYIAEVSTAVPDTSTIETNMDRFLMEETGHKGWTGFLKLELRSGIRTLPAGGLDVSEPWVVAFWVLEWVVVSWIVGAFGVRLATFPRCNRCDRWLIRESVGKVSESAWMQAISKSETFGVDDLRAWMAEGQATEARFGKPMLHVVADHCDRCDPSRVRLRLVGRGGQLLTEMDSEKWSPKKVFTYK